MTLRDIAKKIYRTFIPVPPIPELPVFSGGHSKRFWTTRDDLVSSAPLFWEGRFAPARQMIAESVASLSGSSVLEIGTHAGPTLWAIAQQRHFDRLAGTELSAPALAFAKETLPAALGRDVELVMASADCLPFPDRSFDIIVTAVALVCIGPDEIQKSLTEMLRVARSYLVLGEPQAAFAAEDFTDRNPKTTYWVRNYARLLAGRATLISSRVIPAEFQLGHLRDIAVFEINPALHGLDIRSY